jgi:exopolysaccharide biosynthesis protein
MARSTFVRLVIVINLIFVYQSVSGQHSDYDNIPWERERIASGLIWKSSHIFLYDSVAQNINLLKINLNKRKLSLLYNPKQNVIVSKQVEEAEAIAAVNAGFFNIKDGGSVTYIKTGGMILDSDTAKKWTRNVNLNGSILIDINSQVSIDRARINSWYDINPEFSDVLVTGPLLIKDKVKIQLPPTPLVTNRHPRTVIGKVGKNRIIIVTLDGRTDQAKGMTLAELTDLMLSLKCKDAVNLDGGGSTTMWIAGKSINGVVNMPCDNGKYDHEGERAVSDILVVR